MKRVFIPAKGSDSLSLHQKTVTISIQVNIPHTGYVGVGVVTEPVEQVKDAFFEIKDEKVEMADLPLRGNYFYSVDDPDNAEHLVKVHWLKTVMTSEAVKELGFFGNQNSVRRPLTEKWNFTVDRLKKCWRIE